jgi:hypothetical protein
MSLITAALVMIVYLIAHSCSYEGTPSRASAMHPVTEQEIRAVVNAADRGIYKYYDCLARGRDK